MIRYLIAMALMGVVGLAQADVRGTVFGAAQSRSCDGDCAQFEKNKPYGGAAITWMAPNQGGGAFFEAGATYQGPYMGGGLLHRSGDFVVMGGPTILVERADYEFEDGYGQDETLGVGLGGLVELAYKGIYARYTYYQVGLDFFAKKQVGTDAQGDPIYNHRQADVTSKVNDFRIGYRWKF